MAHFQMLDRACNKIQRLMSDSSSNDPREGSVHRVCDITSDACRLSSAAKNQPPDLATAQRVLGTVRQDPRAQQLRTWSEKMQPDGALVVDIVHPMRCVAALFLGPGRIHPNDTVASYYACLNICEPEIYEQCRENARSLAADAGLVITNDMLPPNSLPLSRMRCPL